MARVLIGWEFGANRGHALRLAALGKSLRAEGHEPLLAVQRVDAITPEEAGGIPVWQAPVTPRLLVSGPRARHGPPAGMADILARLGLDDPAIVAAMVRGWRQLIATLRAQAAIADFAPFLLCAARGRVPAFAVGTGFSAPPPLMAEFPRLVEGAEGVDQRAVLEQANAGLRAAGAAEVDALPALFGADRNLAATFAELDPYAARRTESALDPLPAGFEAKAGSGEEIFVYAPESFAPDSPLWQGLKISGLPVRVHVARAAAGTGEALTALGFAFEPEPVPFARIAERSRLLLSHGGHGFVCAGLAAGLPHVVFHYDLEKLLNGAALARAQLGGHVSLRALEPKAFARSLVTVYRDDALAARAKAAGPGFRRRGRPRLDQAAAEALASFA